MKPYILNMKVSGIKNIEEEIEIEFYKKKVGKKIDFTDYNVKAIYGMNGSGKSGIIHAMDIFKNIIGMDVLNDSTYANRVMELINKKTNKFTIELNYVIVYTKINERQSFYKHRIEVENENNGLFISKEIISSKTSYDGKENMLLVSENGKVIETIFDNKMNDMLINRVEKRSMSEIIRTFFLTKENVEKYKKNMSKSEKKIFEFIILTSLICLTTTVVMEEQDLETNEDGVIMKKTPAENTKFLSYLLDGEYMNRYIGIVSSKTDYVSIKKYDEYVLNIKKLEKFIKLFKEELVCIDIEKTEKKDVFIIEKLFNYGDYRINTAFESAGIKKLIKIYNAIDRLSEGEIVFFDELDANINDVYLIRLIEYVSEYTRGQLVFTTHNLGPMEILKKKKKSIDFLSSDSKLVSYKKNGNYSVARLYREGMIENQPFNIEAYDFLSIFGGDFD